MAIAGIVLVSCGPKTEKSAGPISDHDLMVMARGNDIKITEQLFNRAKDAFKSGQWDRALELTEGLATAPTARVGHTHFRVRSRTLRTVIYAGQLKGRMELAEAYGQGADKAKNPQFKAEYRRLQNDHLQAAAHAALNLAETARQLAPDGVISKTVPLETSIPPTEGPVEIAALERVKEGGWLEPDQQESAAADSLRKGMDDALAEVVSGDLAKARTVFADGPANLEGAAFAIFLAQELADGAIVFDRHHRPDSLKMKTLCDQGQETLKAALARLQDNPDKDKEKEVKKLQDRFKTLLKKG
jgi:hypothetical protein